VGSLGVAEANENTMKGITSLFLALGIVKPTNLMAYYGPPANPLPDQPPPTISIDLLKKCLDAVPPPLSTPHKDGWRNEHIS
jgi:hypothetical protein